MTFTPSDSGSTAGRDAAAEPAPKDRRNVLQSALSAIEKLQARIEATEEARHEPIAIVGLALRAPGGVEDAAGYWRVLSQGLDVVGEVPPDRWDVDAFYDPDPNKLGKARTKSGGFLDQIDGFEPSFFGMSPREATGVDPQQRLLLETSWEALEDAGIAPDSLEGSRTGVFVGITSTDYAQRLDVNDPARSDIYLATGTALNAAAGRISFTLGLRGPCMAIDTACSSSLVAIHTACQSLRNGESQLVLAGGVNVMMSPEPFVMISKWGMLSPDGRCKTFDAAANGFVRGEGCGMIVLERLSDAVAKGRRVLAVIRGSAINQDGRSSGLTVPNGPAQQEVVRQALQSARLKPTDISYVEAHGTGTSLGDPIEVEALAAVYGAGRSMNQPFEIGSVKSNIAHLEAASGVMSVIKLVLSLERRQIPASLHVRNPTPDIPWAQIPVRISTTLHDWIPQGGSRLAGVSAFGFSGMNAHLILEQAPESPVIARPPSARPLLMPLSSKTVPALQALAARHADHLENHPEIDAADACATAATGRAQLIHRLAIVAPDRAALIEQLRAAARGEGPAIRGHANPGARVRTAFLFTGQGAQYSGMGRVLYDSVPAFRDAFDRCAAVLDGLLPRPLRELVFEEHGLLDQTGNTQPALYALEVSIAEMWRSWGIRPTAVIGHSVGEFAAAAVAGVFSIEDGARLIAKRASLMQAQPAGGVMLSVQGDIAMIEREVASHAGKVSIAARNAPGTLVIAGEREAVSAIGATLTARGLHTQPLLVSHAFHSPLMAPMVAEFRSFAAGVTHSPPSIPWFSNLSGAPIDWSEWGHRMGDYWARHVMEPVAFERGIQSLAAAGCEVCLEIGPHPVLCGMGRLSVEPAANAAKPIDWLPTLKRGQPAWNTLCETIGRLSVRGAAFDWQAFLVVDAPRNVPLPTYPFQRQRFLIDMPKGPARAQGKWVHDLLGVRLPLAGSTAQFERRVTRTDPPWLADHCIGSDAVMPLTAYLELSVAAARQVYGADCWALRGIEVAEPMILREGEERVLQVSVAPSDAGSDASTVRVFSRETGKDDAPWTLHATSQADRQSSRAGSTIAGEDLDVVAARCDEPVDADAFYEKLRGMGVDFGPAFQGMRAVRRNAAGEALGEISLSTAVLADAGKYGLHPALLDACQHVTATVMEALPGADDGRLYLPVGVDRYELGAWPAASTETLRSYARVRNPEVRGETMLIDLRVEAADGRPVATLTGLRCRRVARNAFQQRMEAQIADWFYQVKWREQARVPGRTRALQGRWLILDDGTGRGERLAAEIAARGGVSLTVQPGRGLARTGEGTVTINQARAEDYQGLLQQACAQEDLAGIVSLWPLRIPALRDDDVPSAIQEFGTDAALRLLHALDAAAMAPAPRLWFVTRGSQSADGTERVRIEQAAVAGLARVATSEYPDHRVTLVDLDPQTPTDDVRALADELGEDDSERQIAIRKGLRMIARLHRGAGSASVPVDEAPVRLNIKTRGTLENLVHEPDVRRPPAPGQVEIRVRSSGLNFRDVLSALGMYPGEIARLGTDCAGEVVAVGSDVTAFRVGDRVAAMVEGAFSSHATTRWEFVAPLPKGVDFDQGAAIPTAYLTADITLNQIAHMKKGDRVLIHSGAGGVGMAAIALAHQVGAEIFATAGSPEKRAVLAQLGVQHVLDSRSASFADEIQRITAGKGVDIVLNSLAGALLDRSFEVLADGGIFLEIGKRGLWTHEQVDRLGRGIRYHIVDCNDNARDTPELVGAIFARVLKEIESGALPLLPCTTFPFERASDAFRYMAQARHIGRVVFRHRHDPVRKSAAIRADATYLVTGGARGLGLLAAQWLADEGARHLLLAGRSAPDGKALQAIEGLRAGGARVEFVAADVATATGVARIMGCLEGSSAALPEIGGVIHCAAVLDDGVLAKQTPERFAAVMAPKADGAWRLDRALRAGGQHPDFFVMYSSMSSVLGVPGQGNYVAANAFLDALAHQRRADDVPAMSVNWGAWKEVGMAIRGNTVARAGAQGLLAIAPAEGMQALGILLRYVPAQACVNPVDWPQMLRNLGDGPAPTLLQDVVSQARDRLDSSRSATPVERVTVDYAALEPDERVRLLADMVRRELATVLAMGDATQSILDDQTFTGLGLDSLTSVELRNRLQQATARSVPSTAAFEHPSVGEMARYLDSLFDTRVAGDHRLDSILATSRPARPPLSFAQERLWFFQQLEPRSALFNLSIALRLKGKLDRAALDSSIRLLVQRHESLRTVLPTDADGPYQRVLEAVGGEVPCEDLARLEGDALTDALMAAVAREAGTPFDLALGPLLRPRLLRGGELDHVLLLTLHHVIGDGVSIAILMRDWAECYRASVAGEAPRLEVLPVQYIDFAVWQRTRLSGERLVEQLEFWRQELGGAPAYLDLPLDLPRPAVQTYNGALCQRVVPGALRSRLEALGESESATLFMTMFAAFAHLLGRQSGQDDVSIGLAVAGRVARELEQLVGLFINTLVLRTRLRPDMSFEQLLRAVRKSALNAFEHQELPFEKVVEELHPPRDQSRSPMFQVLFNMLGVDVYQSLQLPGMEATPYDRMPGVDLQAKFDLTLYVNDQQGQLGVTAVYNADLFTAGRIEDLLDQYVALLASVAESPARPIGECSLLTVAAAPLVPDATAPLGGEWHGTVQSRVSLHAASAPARIAVQDAAGSMSYGQLDRLSNQLAHHLIAQGVTREDRLAIVAERNMGLAWAMLGALKSGAAFVVLDATSPVARLASNLAVAGASVLIDVTEAALSMSIPGGQGLHRIAWRNGDADAWRQWPDTAPDVATQPDDLAYLVFTSGSTGVPKAIAGTHAPLSHFFEWHRQTWGLSPEDRFSVLSGLAHDPLLRDVLGALWAGATVVMPDAACMGAPGYLADWMRRERVTVAHLTPAMADLISIGRGATAPAPLPNLRHIFFGGDALTGRTVATLRRLAPHAGCVNFYGASETPQAIAFHRVPDDAGAHPSRRVPLGRGIEDVQLLILNEAGHLAGIGELGEICVRTPYLARGYLGDAVLTAARFVVNPATSDSDDRMYRTGDLGRYRPDGAVEYHGRGDAQVKIRGYRIELGEVAAVLREHPALADAAAALKDGGDQEARLVAYYVAAAGKSCPGSDELRTFMLSWLPDYMVPVAFVALDQLPLTLNGKLDVARLLQPSAPEQRQRMAPRNDVEAAIAAIWREVLGATEIGVEDNFFELGGHSLKATRVLSRLRAQLNVEVPLRALFESPTIALLAKHVEFCQEQPGAGAGADREEMVF